MNDDGTNLKLNILVDKFFVRKILCSRKSVVTYCIFLFMRFDFFIKIKQRKFLDSMRCVMILIRVTCPSFMKKGFVLNLVYPIHSFFHGA